MPGSSAWITSSPSRLAPRPWLPPGEQPDSAYPFVLVTGRRLEHYNTGSMTRRTANLALVPEELLDVHPDDASPLGLRDGRAVTVTSRRASTTLTARITPDVAPGTVFAAFHFPDAAVNTLTSQHTDTDTGCPEYKVTAVRLAAAGAP